MDKNKTKKQKDKDTLAEVTKEMAKPRVAMSARIAHEANDSPSDQSGTRYKLNHARFEDFQFCRRTIGTGAG
jgi:hypothetical protein